MDLAKARIFLSYSWHDKRLALRLGEKLKFSGKDVWIDESEVRAGEVIAQKVNEALEWCNILVLLWSAKANKSDWVRMEWSSAVSLKKKIILCKLDETKVPPILACILHLNFSNFDKGFKDLIYALNTENPKIGIEIEIVSGSSKKLDDETIHLRLKALYDLSEKRVRISFSEKGFYDKMRYREAKGIEHQYKTIGRAGQDLVMDFATGLMWEQGGTKKEVTHEFAKKQIEQYNATIFAKYDNWRLPTLEEIMSLMEPFKVKYLYVNPLFAKKQAWIWTVDKENAQRAWTVAFDRGYCLTNHVLSTSYVRAVRTIPWPERRIESPNE